MFNQKPKFPDISFFGIVFLLILVFLGFKLDKIFFVKAATEFVSVIRENCAGYSDCYTSLASWEAVRNRNLVDADAIEVARIEGTWTNADTSRLSINGWTTDATRYIKIYTTPEARHSGKWDTTKYRLEPSSAGDSIIVYNPNVRIEGLQIAIFDGSAIRNLNSVSGDFVYSHNILKGTSSNYRNGIFAGFPGVFKIFNNIIYDFNGLESTGIYVYSASAIAYVYNNTLVGNTSGIYARTGATVAKNNLIKGSGVNSYSSTFSAGTDYNSTDSADNIGQGANNRISQTFSFIDEASKDFRLSSSDTGARDFGANLSSDANLAFSDDIDGTIRPQGSAWDIGADEASGGGAQPTYQCSDNIDNDSDGLTDYPNDSGCSSTTDNDEYNTPITTDTTPPTRSNGLPTGSLSSGTTSATLSVNTNENSTCRYSINANINFASIANTFTTTGGTTHAQTLTGLINGTSYAYYVRCQDTIGNANADDYQITFSVVQAEQPSQPQTTVENLDEMFNRKARRLTNAFPDSQLEDSANNYIWQPETFMYRDVTTGNEVWKMSNTPSLTSYYHNDIGLPVWSADGKRTAFSSVGRITQAYSLTQQQEWQSKWMVLNTNGSFMRPVVEAARRIGGGYFEWSPQIPEVFYEIGETHLGTGAQANVLYKSTLNNSNVINRTSLITGISGIINKMLSSDGRKVIVENLSTYYPATVYPDSAAGLNDNGYSMDRNFGLYGNMPATAITNYHDQYIAGDGSWFYAMPSGSSVWWRMKTLGSAVDGGPLYTGNNGSNNFGEVWPENHGSGSGLSSPFVQADPYISTKTCYWSHFTPDRWGKRALFSSTCDGLPNGYGPGTWDIQNHQWNVSSFGGGTQHHDWHGFTDYVISSRGTGSDSNYLNDRIYIAKYNDPASQQTIAYTHTLYNSDGIYGGAGTQYASLTRPAQSPDGTKVAFHSTFLNASDYNPDIFWAVAYYPYSPTNLSATYQSGINLQWLPPKYTDRGWPYASPNPSKDSLGWPLLDASGNEIGEPLYAREIKKYHIWRSSSQTGPWQEVGTTNADYSTIYAEDPSMFMLHPIASGLKVSPTNKISFIDNSSDGVFYYAITSEEHSGLESDKLSEIIRVTKSGSNVSSQIVASQGQNNFWRELPQAPTAFSYTAQTTAGHYRLNWTEPNDSKIRYYNIYYSTTGNPQAIQQQKIASAPVGANTYLDWLASQTQQGYYGITSVDRYGNESTIVLIGGNIQPTYQCSDNIDNDSDGLTDYLNDSGCSSTTDNDEYNAPIATDTTPPTISNISSSVTTSSATIAFSTSESSDTQVQYGLTTSYGQTTTLDVNLVISHSQTISGLTPNTTYNYRVITKDSSGNTSTSLNYTFATQAVPDSTPPSAISNLSLSSISQSSMILSFTVPTDASGILGYDIRYDTSPITNSNFNVATQVSNPPTPSSQGTTQQYTLVGLASDTVYYFAIKSRDPLNNTSNISNTPQATTLSAPSTQSQTPSDQSGTVSVSSSGGGFTIYQISDSTSPNTPASAKASPSSSQISLSWTNPQDSDFVRVKIIRKTGSQPTSPTDGALIYEGNQTVFTDTNLSNNQIYYYAIYAYDNVPNYSTPQILSATPLASLTQISTIAQTTQTQSSSSIQEGSLIRGPDGIKVYIVNAHNYKRHIFNPEVFNMYGHFKWNEIKEVNQQTLDSYQSSDLYRADTDTKVFSLKELDEKKGLAQKRWFNLTGDAFIQKGYNFNQVFIINTKERDFYQEGTPISETESANYPSGSLIKSSSSPDIYLVISNKKIKIKDQETLLNWNYSFNQVQEVNPENLNQFQDLNIPSYLVKAKGDTKIYRIISDQKLWIKTTKMFLDSGYLSHSEIEISPEDLNLFPDVKYIKIKNSSQVYELKNNRKYLLKDISKIPDQDIKIVTEAERAGW